MNQWVKDANWIQNVRDAFSVASSPSRPFSLRFHLFLPVLYSSLPCSGKSRRERGGKGKNDVWGTLGVFSASGSWTEPKLTLMHNRLLLNMRQAGVEIWGWIAHRFPNATIWWEYASLSLWQSTASSLSQPSPSFCATSRVELLAVGPSLLLVRRRGTLYTWSFTWSVMLR